VTLARLLRYKEGRRRIKPSHPHTASEITNIGRREIPHRNGAINSRIHQRDCFSSALHGRERVL
jgi:hypothetical protein